MSAITPLEALRRLVDVARLIDAKECPELYNQLHGELAVAESVLAQPFEAAKDMVDDLVMLVRKLVHSLSKADPSHALPARALDYLKRKGLQGSPLRTSVMIDNGIEQAAKFIEKKAENYDADCGISDPDTGAREYPGDGAEYFNGLMELAEEIRALSATTTATVSVAPSGEVIERGIVPDWPFSNPGCDYEDPHGGKWDFRTRTCECDAAKNSIARQLVAINSTKE